MKKIPPSVSKGSMQLFSNVNNIYNTGRVSKKNRMTEETQILIWYISWRNPKRIGSMESSDSIL